MQEYADVACDNVCDRKARRTQPALEPDPPDCPTVAPTRSVKLGSKSLSACSGRRQQNSSRLHQAAPLTTQAATGIARRYTKKRQWPYGYRSRNAGLSSLRRALTGATDYRVGLLERHSTMWGTLPGPACGVVSPVPLVRLLRHLLSPRRLCVVDENAEINDQWSGKPLVATLSRGMIMITALMMVATIGAVCSCAGTSSGMRTFS
jgi:hypothetical protein